MKEPFTLARAAYLGLKSATKNLCEAFGNQQHAAEIVRTGQQDLSDYGSRNRFDRFMPIDVVADLESKMGPVVTTELARLAGYVLVQLPQLNPANAHLMKVTSEALKEVSDVFARLSSFLEDGTLSAAEGSQLDREIEEAIVKLLALKAQIDALAGKSGLE